MLRRVLRHVRRKVLRATLRRPLESAQRAGVGQERAYAIWKHVERTGRLPRLRRPRSLNDRLLAKALNDRRDFIVQAADKIAVRDYVAGRVGSDVLIDVLYAGGNLDDCPLEQFDTPYVVKASHAAGREWMRIVTDPAGADFNALREAARRWQQSEYQAGTHEWWYGRMLKRVIVERFVGDPAAGPPNDYKLWVIAGRVVLIQLDVGRGQNQRRDFYSPGWERFDVRRRYPNLDRLHERPPTLARMIEVAEKLAVDTPFVRIDLYDEAGTVRFGEMTHCPAAGFGQWSDPTFDEWLATRWSEGPA